ncbi:aspartate dehydrogenase [Rhizobiales bacterium GAS188]|nr:aspartate dehydrogenase [Rhizobiales bacterium GAS188]
MKRVGLIGFGFIGAALWREITQGRYPGLELGFVWNRSPEKLTELPPDLVLGDLAQAPQRGVDLVIESAHPAITIEHGAAILANADYMPLSVTALADDDLRDTLLAAASGSGHKLLLPQGALVGTDALFQWRHMWRDVMITFRKHPRNLDLARVDRQASEITSELVLYDGPVRGIASLYPRNVNTMVTCALATIGVDRCRARLIADPSLDHAVAEVEAFGRDGSYLSTVKRQPAVGVSGTEMIQSTLRSLSKATGALDTIDFV